MTLIEFKAAVALTRLSLDGQATYGALLVLVDMRDMDDAAPMAGCTRQAISAAISRIRRALKRCPYCGAGVRGRKKVPARP